MYVCVCVCVCVCLHAYNGFAFLDDRGLFPSYLYDFTGNPSARRPSSAPTDPMDDEEGFV